MKHTTCQVVDLKLLFQFYYVGSLPEYVPVAVSLFITSGNGFMQYPFVMIYRPSGP